MDRQIGLEIKVISNLVKRRIDKNAAAIEIAEMTGMQMWFLHYLIINTPKRQVYQREIEKEFGVRRSTATVILQQLEGKGLIERLPVETDARLKSIILTDTAKKFQREMEKSKKQIDKDMRTGISKEDMATFFAVIDKIKQNLEEKQ